MCNDKTQRTADSLAERRRAVKCHSLVREETRLKVAPLDVSKKQRDCRDRAGVDMRSKITQRMHNDLEFRSL
jgi:hypothetical protein